MRPKKPTPVLAPVAGSPEQTEIIPNPTPSPPVIMTEEAKRNARLNAE